MPSGAEVEEHEKSHVLCRASAAVASKEKGSRMRAGGLAHDEVGPELHTDCWYKRNIELDFAARGIVAFLGKRTDGRQHDEEYMDQHDASENSRLLGREFKMKGSAEPEQFSAASLTWDVEKLLLKESMVRPRRSQKPN